VSSITYWLKESGRETVNSLGPLSDRNEGVEELEATDKISTEIPQDQRYNVRKLHEVKNPLKVRRFVGKNGREGGQRGGHESEGVDIGQALIKKENE